MPIHNVVTTLQAIPVLGIPQFLANARETSIEARPTLADTRAFIAQAQRACSVARRDIVQALMSVDIFTLGPKALIGFPNFDRYNVACGLTLRLLDPALLKQQNTDLCGIVAFAADLARQKPVSFAQLVTHLADKGRAQLDTWSVEPHISVRSVPAGHKSVPQVDWVCLASLRDTLNDAGNFIFNVVRHWQLHPMEGVGRDDVCQLALRGGYARVFSPGFGEQHIQHGGAFIPPSQNLSKQDAVFLAAKLFDTGWTIFLLADIVLDKALQDVNKATGTAHEMAGMLGQQAAQKMVQDAQQRAADELTRKKYDSGHAMLVANLRVTPGQNPTVSLTVINRGERHNFQNIPIAAFCTHMASYVAATNRPSDSIGHAAVIDALSAAPGRNPPGRRMSTSDALPPAPARNLLARRMSR